MTRKTLHALAAWYHPTKKPHLKLVAKGGKLVSTLEPGKPPAHPAPTSESSERHFFSARIDPGAIIVAIVGFLLVFMVNLGVGKLDKLTDQITFLNEKMATVLADREMVKEKFATQKEEDAKQNERIHRLEELIIRK